MFNGKDLTGWTPKIKGHELGDNFADTFRVEDGVLRVSYDGYEKFDVITKHCTSSRSKTYHGDQWVLAEIEVHGNGRIVHRIQGETVLEYERPQLDPNDHDAQKLIKDGNVMLDGGYIALQSESHPIEFRNIEIRTLPAVGLLRTHPTNPRYFTDGTINPDGSAKAVYLTGSHTWNNLVDMGQGDPPAAVRFPGLSRLPGATRPQLHPLVGLGLDVVGHTNYGA